MVCRFGRRSFFARRFKVITGSLIIVGLIHYINLLLIKGHFDDIGGTLEPTLKRVKRNKTESTTEKSTTSSTTTSTTTTSIQKKARVYATLKTKQTERTTKPTTTKSTSKGTTTTVAAVCSSKRPVVFLKTHKTASTSLTNIILRYAENNKFLVGLPPEKKWELAGYPAKFIPELIDPIASKTYDVLAHHFRWSDSVDQGLLL